MAGGINQKLNPGDVVVCTKSIRDEGTSHHYVKNAKYAFATKDLTDALFVSLSKEFKRLCKGSSWTIDAPYRETVKELIHYRSEDVDRGDGGVRRFCSWSGTGSGDISGVCDQ